MTVYNRQIQQALKQIDKKGALVPYSRVVVTAADPLKPWQTTTTPQTANRKLLFLPLNEEDKKTVSRIAGTETGKQYYKALMGNQGFEPNKNDTVLFAGKTFNVLDLNILRPDGEIILTTFILKG
jgi:hypothetical protein